MPLDSGRKVLITGGAAGIGAATAKVCAHVGAEIVIVDKEDAGQVGQAQVNALG